MEPQPKPTKTVRRSKHKTNPKPTAADWCRDCGKPYAQMHEVYGGPYRNASIEHGMQRRLCLECHAFLKSPDGHNRNIELKRDYQRRFETTHSQEEFIKTFGQNYLIG